MIQVPRTRSTMHCCIGEPGGQSRRRETLRARGQPLLCSCIPHPDHMYTGEMNRGRMQAQALPSPTHPKILLPIPAWGKTGQSGTPRAVRRGTGGEGEFPSPAVAGKGLAPVSRSGRCRCSFLQRCKGLVCSDPDEPATLWGEMEMNHGFAGSSDHIHELQEKARSDLNPLPALGKGTRAAFTMQMNQLRCWHRCLLAPVASSAGKGIISAGLLSCAGREQGCLFQKQLLDGFSWPFSSPDSKLIPAHAGLNRRTLLFPAPTHRWVLPPVMCWSSASGLHLSKTHPATHQTFFFFLCGFPAAKCTGSWSFML